jgi:hypothetical protein
MKTALLRQFLPLSAALMAALSLSSSAFGEAANSQLLLNQWIRQSEDGSIQGQIIVPEAGGAALAVSPAAVALANDSGIVSETMTDEDGSFEFADVAPGVYTIISRGAKDLGAIVALHVVAFGDERASGLSSSIQVSAASVDFASVNSTLIRYLPPSRLESSLASIADVDVNAISQRVSGPAFHRVAQSDGGMVGQVYGTGAVGNALTPSTQANVFLFKNGIEIERLITDDSGRFEVTSMEPGIYSALIVGNTGSGLVGFELVGDAARSFANTGANGETLTSAVQEGVASQFVLQLAPGDGVVDTFQGMGDVVSDTVVSEEVVGEEIVDDGFGVPMGGGGVGGGGGGFGGGGGGGGIGGAGGLLGLGAIGAAIAAAVSGNDGDRVIVTPPPATNATP